MRRSRLLSPLPLVGEGWGEGSFRGESTGQQGDWSPHDPLFPTLSHGRGVRSSSSSKRYRYFTGIGIWPADRRDSGTNPLGAGSPWSRSCLSSRSRLGRAGRLPRRTGLDRTPGPRRGRSALLARRARPRFRHHLSKNPTETMVFPRNMRTERSSSGSRQDHGRSRRFGSPWVRLVRRHRSAATSDRQGRPASLGSSRQRERSGLRVRSAGSDAVLGFVPSRGRWVRSACVVVGLLG